MTAQDDIADPIVSATLDVDGTPTGRVLIGRPVVEDDGITWRCEYRIDGLSEAFRHHVCGVDALQALVLTLELMPVLLEQTREAHQGRLTWHDQGAPWGFPSSLYGTPPAMLDA